MYRSIISNPGLTLQKTLSKSKIMGQLEDFSCYMAKNCCQTNCGNLEFIQHSWHFDDIRLAKLNPWHIMALLTLHLSHHIICLWIKSCLCSKNKSRTFLLNQSLNYRAHLCVTSSAVIVQSSHWRTNSHAFMRNLRCTVKSCSIQGFASQRKVAKKYHKRKFVGKQLLRRTNNINLH